MKKKKRSVTPYFKINFPFKTQKKKKIYKCVCVVKRKLYKELEKSRLNQPLKSEKRK